MADTIGYHIDTSPLFGTVDPFDFLSVIMPVVALVDATAPTATAITFISTPASPSDPVVVQAADVNTLTKMMLGIKHANGEWEYAFDGVDWSPRYKLGSSISVVSSSIWQATIRRQGGWPGDFKVSVQAVDINGNVS